MNKADLIEAVAIKCDISKLAAQRALPQTIEQPMAAKQSIEVGTSTAGSTAPN